MDLPGHGATAETFFEDMSSEHIREMRDKALAFYQHPEELRPDLSRGSQLLLSLAAQEILTLRAKLEARPTPPTVQ